MIGRPILVLACLGLGCRAMPSSDPFLRSTTAGPIVGLAEQATGTWAWLGIPYAAPPVGALRWKAPRDPRPWDSPLATQRFGWACPQIGGLQGPGPDGRSYGPDNPASFGKVVGSEDCLTINLWQPATDRSGRPVVVFVHGGANVVGFSGDPLYHGARLARALDAVVISLNYRLGVLGFFRHPALLSGNDSASDSGNFGLLDVLKGLDWVRRNVAAFGGDPDNVTLIGQSAGAVNALCLMVSPHSKGLFSRVVALSGALLTRPIEEQERYADAVAAAVRRSGPVTGRSTDVILRAADAATLVRAGTEIEGGGLAAADGYLLPADPGAALAAGAVQPGPLLIGVTAEEGKFFVPQAFGASEAERFRLMYHASPDGPQVAIDSLLKPEHRGPGAFDTLAAGMTGVVSGLILQSLEQFSTRSDPTYAMRFVWKTGREPWRTVIGASHAMELPFVFGNFDHNYFWPAFASDERTGREALSAVLQGALGSYLRTGSPNGSRLGAKWEPYRPTMPAWMIFDATKAEARLAAR